MSSMYKTPTSLQPSIWTSINLDDPFIFYLHPFLQVAASILRDAFLNIIPGRVEWLLLVVVSHLTANCSMRIATAASKKVNKKGKSLKYPIRYQLNWQH